MEQEDREISHAPGIRPPVHKDEDRGKPKFTEFTKKCSLTLLRSDGKIKHFTGRWPEEYYNYKPVGMLYDVDMLDQKKSEYIFPTDVSSSSKFWIGKKADRRIKLKQGRETKHSLKDLQDILKSDVKKMPPPCSIAFYLYAACSK
jgi:hypothetical protein